MDPRRTFSGKSRKIYLKLIASLLSFMGLAISTAIVLHMIKGDLVRAPASVVTNDEGEPVFWEESIDDLNRDSARMQGARLSSGDLSQVFASLGPEKEKVRQEEADRRTGIKTLRARRAKFVPEALYASLRTRNRSVVLNLFEDTKLRALLNAPSAYRTNAGVYTGTLVNDPESRIHLYVEDDHINGFIETARQKFRVLDSGFGDSFIIEQAP